jgi:hypothetical protein
MTTIDIEAARAILRANDRGGYTVPTDRLYPFQWNWDSAFVAMGWATFDEERAWRELERLVEGQWDDGMVPHIVFHAPSDDYFPGPDVWRTRHAIPTSGITQPPVFATALRRVFEIARGPDAQARAARLYRCALASHDWWEKARDPEGTGLVAILHPWESGMDNSPAWDEAMARLTVTPTTPIRRRDTSHIGADMRPRDEDYRRFIALVDLYAGLGWEPAAMWRASPFKLVDVATNAILHKAEEDLLVLAAQFGTEAERSRIEARMARRAAAFAGLWNQDRRILPGARPRHGQDGRGLDLGWPAAALCRHPRGRAGRCARRGAGKLARQGALSGAEHLAARSSLRAEALLARAGLGGGELHDRRGLRALRTHGARQPNSPRHADADAGWRHRRIFRPDLRRRTRRRPFLLDRGDPFYCWPNGEALHDILEVKSRKGLFDLAKHLLAAIRGVSSAWMKHVALQRNASAGAANWRMRADLWSPARSA